jgi:hypothetical protein
VPGAASENPSSCPVNVLFVSADADRQLAVAPEMFDICQRIIWWAHKDSNLGPAD